MHGAEELGVEIMYNINNMPVVLSLGNQGEANAHKIEIDISEWLKEHPDAAIGISVTTPIQSEPFISPGVSLSGDILNWLIPPQLTAEQGSGTAVIRCSVGDKEKRSVRVFTSVSPGHGPTGPVPEAMEDYVSEVVQAGQGAKADAARAKDARDAAEGFAGDAQTAQGLAESARGDAYMYADYAEENATIARNAAIESVSAKNLSLQYRDATQGYAQSALVAKQGAESARDLAQGYVNTFIPAEQSRISAEGVRQSSETSRENAEDLREIAETARQNARIKSAHADGDNLVFTKQDNTSLVVTDALKSVNDAAQSSIDSEIVSGSANGNNLVFTRSDSATITVADALKPMTDIVSDVGIELAKLQGITFAINADGELEVEI